MHKNTCSGCDANPARTPDNFALDRNSPDGLFHRCKVCEADRLNIHYYNNQSAILEKRYQEYHDNADEKRAYFAQKRREYRAREREQVAAGA